MKEFGIIKLKKKDRDTKSEAAVAAVTSTKRWKLFYHFL
jgi:hypothetical protein